MEKPSRKKLKKVEKKGNASPAEIQSALLIAKKSLKKVSERKICPKGSFLKKGKCKLIKKRSTKKRSSKKRSMKGGKRSVRKHCSPYKIKSAMKYLKKSKIYKKAKSPVKRDKIMRKVLSSHKMCLPEWLKKKSKK